MTRYLIEEHIFSLGAHVYPKEVLWRLVINKAKPIKTVLDSQPKYTP